MLTEATTTVEVVAALTPADVGAACSRDTCDQPDQYAENQRLQETAEDVVVEVDRRLQARQIVAAVESINPTPTR